jgi:hypothetical protein
VGTQANLAGMRGISGMDLSALLSNSFREQPIQALAARALAASALGATSLSQGMGPGGAQMNLGGVMGPGGQLGGMTGSMGLMQSSVPYNGGGSLLSQQGVSYITDSYLCCAMNCVANL